MNFFSDTQETAARFGDEIDDLHDVFRCHGVDFGAPEDFFAFARTLKYHSELRGDLLRVVKSVMESGTNISFRTILTVIAVASGGPDVAMFDREMSTPVHQVIESLIGVGTSGKVDADPDDHSFSDLTAKETVQILALDSSLHGDGGATGDKDALEQTDVRGQTDAAGHVDAPEHSDEPVNTGVEEPLFEEPLVEEPLAEEPLFEEAASDSSLDQSLTSSESLPYGHSGSSSGHQGSLNDFGGSNTLAESLTRLELNSLQLRIYLDSIDQRISRMEPRLENVGSFVPSTPRAHTREEPGARFSAAVPAAVAAATIPEKTEPRLPHSDLPVRNQEDKVAAAGGVASGPLAVVARLRRDSRDSNPFRSQIALPILVGVGVLLLAASLFWRFGRDSGSVVIQPAKASVEGGPNVAGANVAPGTAASGGGPQGAIVSGSRGAAASEPSGASIGGAQGTTSASSYTGHPADKPTRLSKKSAQVPLQSPLRSSSSAAAPTSSAAAPTMAKDAAGVTDRSDGDDDLGSVPLSTRPVDVSSGVMAANLLSAPKPSYPTLASLTRTQGNVVMQAVISKDGTVEELHVIKGHRLLRGAAKNAVRNWRYRPYKIDGVPVEVATTVSVDFSLHR